MQGNLLLDTSLFIGDYGKFSTIYKSKIQVVKKKKYKQFMMIQFDTLEEGLPLFFSLRKISKKIGGVSLLDSNFTAEYFKNINMNSKRKYCMLINILTNSKESLSNAKDEIKQICSDVKCITIPRKHYDQYLAEFWMLKVFFL